MDQGLTPELAHVLTWGAILAAGAFLAAVAVTLLPRHLRTAIPVVAIGAISVSTVAFGSGIAESLPDQIVARHAANAAFAGLQAEVPELEALAEADPMVSYDLAAAFHGAWMDMSDADDRPPTRAGYRAGLVIQQAFWRRVAQIQDASALQVIVLERQILEVDAAERPDSCRVPNAVGEGHGTIASPRLGELRRKLLRAKVQALATAATPLPRFSPAERSAFEARILGSIDPGPGRCARMLAFYARLQEYPPGEQGKWLRSRQFLALEG